MALVGFDEGSVADSTCIKLKVEPAPLETSAAAFGAEGCIKSKEMLGAPAGAAAVEPCMKSKELPVVGAAGSEACMKPKALCTATIQCRKVKLLKTPSSGALIF